MAGNQAVVQFLIEYSERGGNLPEKVKRDLDRLSQSSTQASSVTDKLGQAFNRLEKREPMLAVRAIRSAVDDLAVSSIGATGPLGRLAANFATLGGGGFASLAVLGGVGLALGGLKLATTELLNPLITATQGLEKFTAGLTKAKSAAEQLRDLQTQLAGAAPKAGLLYGLFGNAPGFLGGIGLGAGQALDQAASASQAARDALAASQHRTSVEAIQDLEIQTAALSSNAEEIARVVAAQKGWNAADTEAYVLSAAKHANAVQEHADNERRLQQLERLRREFVAGRLQEQSDLRNSVLGEQRMRMLFFGAGKLPTGLEGAIDLSRRGVTFAPEVQDSMRLGGMSLQDIGNAGAGGGGGGNIAAILPALLGLAGSTRGGAGGMLSGLGGLANVALQSTPILGQVLSFGGGLLSLFSSGQAKVSISRLEQEALEQMRQVQQVPQYLSQNIVTNDLRGAKNRLARLEQLDTVTRGVT